MQCRFNSSMCRSILPLRVASPRLRRRWRPGKPTGQLSLTSALTNLRGGIRRSLRDPRPRFTTSAAMSARRNLQLVKRHHNAISPVSQAHPTTRLVVSYQLQIPHRVPPHSVSARSILRKAQRCSTHVRHSPRKHLTPSHDHEQLFQLCAKGTWASLRSPGHQHSETPQADTRPVLDTR